MIDTSNNIRVLLVATFKILTANKYKKQERFSELKEYIFDG